MSWYKTAKQYTDIGHQGKFVLWFSPDGQQIVKSDPQEYKSFSNKGLYHSDWGKWKKDTSTSPFRGRYDIITKEISVVGTGFEEAPRSLINNLMRSFPGVRTIYIFTSYNTHEVIRVASGTDRPLRNLNAFKEIKPFARSMVYASRTAEKQLDELIAESEDDQKIRLLVDKIISSNRKWTLDELQLQQTYPEKIEHLLKERKIAKFNLFQHKTGSL